MLAFRYGVIGLGLLSACARSSTISHRASAGTADTTPPHVLHDDRFHLIYPAPLQTVGVTGSVVVRATVTPSGTIDTATLQFESASNEMFKTGIRGSLAELRLAPARVGDREISGALVLKLSFQLEPCDTTGGPRLEWSTASMPPLITLRQCRMPRGWVPHHLLTFKHFTLSGRWSTGFGTDVLYLCASEKLPMAYPPFVAPLILLYFREVHEWPAVIKRDPLGGPQVKYFIRLEGELTGPDAVGQFGMAAFVFRPTRVVSAALWSERSCQLRPGAPD